MSDLDDDLELGELVRSWNDEAVSDDAPGPPVAPEPGDEADDDQAGLSRRQRRRAWRRAERKRRKDARTSVRFPIVTRSILIWWLIFALVGLTGGATAAFLWSHFNAEVSELRAENAALQGVIDQAKAEIDARRTETLEQIDAALGPVEEYADEGIRVAEAVGVDPNAVWFVSSLDAEGRPTVGSGFVVASDERESVVLTSFNTVREATVVPGPEILLRNAEEEIVGELWNWNEEQDLALLVLPRPGLPALEWASEQEAAEALGKRVFVLGGLGGKGVTAVPGMVVDQSAAGLQYTAPVGAAYQGGPIVTTSGRVLAVASAVYRPLGFDPGPVRFALPVGLSCGTVLACGGGLTQPAGEGAVGPDPAQAPPTED